MLNVSIHLVFRCRKVGEVGMSETNAVEELIVMRSKGGDGTIYRQRPLVRCKDCRHCTFLDGEQLADCMIKQGWFPVKPDWFCADGEKKVK